MGVLIICFLNPKNDEKSGEEYFSGDCAHYSALFVAMCRSLGIPSRCVYGRIGWSPFLNEGNSKMFSKLDTMSSDEGFAGAQHHGLGPHMWAEFYLQDIGWIPVDPNAGIFGNLNNYKVIMSKGRDIFLSENAPQRHHNGYGYQWVPIYNGCVDGLLSTVYNIEKIPDARSNVYHSLDPFPADALVSYKEVLISDNHELLAKKRKEFLCQIDYCTRDISNWNFEFSKILSNPVWVRSLQYNYDVFVCHMLCKIMGDEKFHELLKEYERLLTNSEVPIKTSLFIQMADNIYGKSLKWFFDQWGKSNGLPHFKVDEVTLEEDDNGWKIRGKLVQSGNSLFTLPVEFSLDTDKGQEEFTVWQRDVVTDFEYQTTNKPLKLGIDVNNNILKLQRMPLQLSRIWDSYPNITLIYGTVSESETNKTAAERFNNDYLGLNSEVIKPDTSITDNDLNTECVVLFGRPSTNKISKRFESIFPIKFNQNNLLCNGINYTKPSQGVAQIVKHPIKPKGQFIIYAGLSATAMLQFGDLYLYDAPNSFVVYDVDRQIRSGDWEETDADLIWNFE